MALALKEAKKGTPSPNPHVGAVITREGKLLAEGFHARAGLAHAEIVAMDKIGAECRGATLYVTLEPCNHHGRTGPCTDAILAAGIERVVIGCSDPMPHVPGAIEKLEQAGISVEVGVLDYQARQLVAGFVKHRRTGLPHVTLKAAVSLDGRIASRSGQARWLTGDKARKEAHALRAAVDCVLVGVRTVLADDPELTVRHVPGSQPVRVVLDSNLRTPTSARLFQGRGSAVWIMHGAHAPEGKKQDLTQLGAQLFMMPESPHGLSVPSVLRLLGDRGMQSVMVEGGAAVYNSFLRQECVERMAIFVAPVLMGDPQAPSLAAFREVVGMGEVTRLGEVHVRRFGPDVLIEGDILERLSSMHGHGAHAD